MTWTYPEGIKTAEWDETIKARRYIGDGSALTGIATGSTAVFPLAQASGGTGATAAVQVVYPLAAASGGTGATSAVQIVYPLAEASGGTGTTTALQVAYPLILASGGTSATASAAARLNLGVHDSGALQATITDQGTSGSAYYANVIYNTTSAGVTASNYTIGTILVVYTA